MFGIAGGVCYDPPLHLKGTNMNTTLKKTLAGTLVAASIFSAATLYSALAAEPTPITVDTTAVGAPISPYIYGQFVEHLGESIYGGIWAEMLQDRKFYFPVTGETPIWDFFKIGDNSYTGDGYPLELMRRSPWLILGDKQHFSMSKENPYVGEHTPTITLGTNGMGGIYQERLALEKGKQYKGRVILAGTEGASVTVRIIWGSGGTEFVTKSFEKLTNDFEKYYFDFTADRSTDNGRLEIIASGKGSVKIGTASLMPADNVYGFRADTMALLKELNSPIYRWPGGNFVSGYNWRDGIGDPDKRPPRKNPAWTGIEHNDMGLDEFMIFCRELKTEPYIAVNTGHGTAEECAAELEYMNGSVDTPMGKLRAKNGNPIPYQVKWWAIGNEMYGNWQIGHTTIEKYLNKHKAVVNAMRAVDPSIITIAVGDLDSGWSKGTLENCSDYMSHISEHTYWQYRNNIVEHIAQPVNVIRHKAAAHRQFRQDLPALAGKDIRIAMDEWNYWYGPNVFGELGTRYFLDDGLGTAAALHEFYRNSDIYIMANYAQTVNVIGCIKTTKTDVEFESTGLVLKLYRERFGVTPVTVEGTPKPLDMAAALTADGRALTFSVVNPTLEPQELALNLKGMALGNHAQQWVITGPERRSHNQPGEPRQIDITTSPVCPCGTLTVAPLSITLVIYDVK